MKHLTILLVAFLMAPLSALAEGDDWGLELSAGANYKVTKRLNLSLKGELRTRNDFQTLSRWNIGFDAAYKLCPYAKVSAGYSFLIDNNREKFSYDDISGEVTRWRPSYWGTRHRVNVSLTGSIDCGRFTFSLRERWQYTYRPDKSTRRYDFIEEEWEDRVVNSSAKNVLRSRLLVEYDIPGVKIDPYVSAELFNSWELEESRFAVGADWRITKKHAVGVYYRYQLVKKNNPADRNMNMLGVEYKFKF